MIRVLIADDHAIVREGLKQILGDADDIVVTGEACSGDEALSLLRSHHYDAALVDISMPGRSGVQLLLQLKAESNDTPVLILSVHPEEQYAVRLLRAGAAGYLCKDAAPEELVTAVCRVAAGNRHISASVAELVLLQGERQGQPLHDRLSAREFQTLRSLAAGSSSGAIAKELHLSVKTVSTYRARILQKLKLATTADLVRYAIEHQLLE